jgi:hypothetical protein
MNIHTFSKLSGFTLAIALSLFVFKSQINAYSSWDRSARPRSAQQRRDCDQYYPLPDNYQNWSNCKNIGQSACGGPEQCACDESQRLVTFKCDQGTYNQCYGERGNGCRGQ